MLDPIVLGRKSSNLFHKNALILAWYIYITKLKLALFEDYFVGYYPAVPFVSNINLKDIGY
jgi:hypothetical protein